MSSCRQNCITTSCPPPQVQAAIKKKVEKQRKRISEQEVADEDIQTVPTHITHHQRVSQDLQVETAAERDRIFLEETLEEMMQGPQRKQRGQEEAEPVNLLPIVDSVFGQVRGVCARVCVCLCSCIKFSR